VRWRARTIVQLHGALRASRPQLKRDPLGRTGTSMPPLISITLWLLVPGLHSPGDAGAAADPFRAWLLDMSAKVIARPDTDSLTQFLGHLQNKLTGFDARFRDAITRIEARASTRAADSLFLEFRNTYLAFAESLSTHLFEESSARERGTMPPTSDSIASMLERHGFALTVTEGNPFVDENVAFFLRKFGSLVTPAMRRYLVLRSAEQQMRFSEDARLEIPWDSVGERIVSWDRFLTDHQDFLWRDAASFWYHVYLETYLTGMDNSRVFRDGDSLDGNVRRSYERFLAKHGGTRPGRLLREYINMLRKNQFRGGTRVDGFLRDHNLHTMLGVQPPLR
jgi:hypothetical protein